MNLQKLKEAEAHFLTSYPDGFADEGLADISKKHPLDRMTTLAREVLSRESFDQPQTLVDNLVRLVSRSSMVSMFEKPKFRDAVHDMNSDERAAFAAAYKKLVHGKQSKGFEEVVDILAARKIARWSVITIGLFYYRPQTEVFVKPTTAKKIVEGLSLSHLEYHPRPDWAFYEGYRTAIEDIRKRVSPSLSSNNAALTGFLMMTL